jgi:hypothetical protein
MIKSGLSKFRVRKHTGGAIAEFGPALIIFFVIILFPLLDFLTFADGVAAVSYAASAAARAAGPATTRALAKANMQQAGRQIIGAEGTPSALTAFAKLKPADNSGLTLTVVEIGNDGQVKNTYADGVAIADAEITSGDNFFQYQVTANYGVGLMWAIPGFPDSMPMTFTGTTMVEHPEGLNTM